MGADGGSASGNDTFLRRTTKSLVSGTVGGFVVCFVGHPFDTLKVRLQTQPVDNPLYTGFLDSLTKTIKWEGVGGLYKGVGSPLVGQMVFKATMFLSYNQTMSMLSNVSQLNDVTKWYTAGAVTGGVISAVEGPIDLFKTKMQYQIIQAKTGADVLYRNVFHAGAVIAGNYGVRGVYQGLSATLARNIPSVSLFLGTFEVLKIALSKPGPSGPELPIERLLLAGGTAGFCYWAFTYPADVIKSAMQSDALDHSERRYKSFVHCASTLYAEGGWKRFYKGYTPCIIRSFVANAALLTTVEVVKKYLNELEAKMLLQ